MLINAGAGFWAGTGSPVGVGPDETLDELIRAGLATAKGRLTKSGARRANREKDLYFG